MTLILFGAGNIGRSFIAPVFSAAGYEIVFVDINQTAVAELNRRGEYTVVLVAPDGTTEQTLVSSVTAIDARDHQAVATAVASADMGATAVGAAGFGSVLDLIAEGLVQRGLVSPNKPLDVILAENIPDAAVLARERIVATIGDGALLPGLVETSIGKMVPIMPAAVAATDPLLVYAEPYNTLIVNRRGFKGAVPEIPDLRPVDNIRAYVDRKLFIHNLGHAAVAYLGHLWFPELTTIAHAIGIPAVRRATEEAMLQSARGLYAEYPSEFGPGALENHIDDLITRFANPALGDTVFRVGRDLARKLGPRDRVVGAMRLLAKHHLRMDAIAAVYRAALEFDAADESGKPFPGDQEVVRRFGLSGLESICGSLSGLDETIPTDHAVIEEIRRAAP